MTPKRAPVEALRDYRWWESWTGDRFHLARTDRGRALCGIKVSSSWTELPERRCGRCVSVAKKAGAK